jgi:hypothetical protein
MISPNNFLGCPDPNSINRSSKEENRIARDIVARLPNGFFNSGDPAVIVIGIARVLQLDLTRFATAVELRQRAQQHKSI